MKKPKFIKPGSTLDQPLPCILLKCLFSLIGVTLIGFAIAFNAKAGFGNDPISVFFDGIRVICGLPIEQLGIASSIVCYVLIVVVIIFGRKHINIGTIIYTLLLGTFIDLGTKLYDVFNLPFTILTRILTCSCGCLMLFLGIAIFISVNFGLDPFTASVMIIKDKLNKSYTLIKVSLDILLLAIGFILGGQVGIVTLVAAVAGGPVINFFTKIVDKIMSKIMKKFDSELTTA